MNPLKEEAKKLIEQLPEEATWDDIMYEFYVRQKIDSAIQSAEAGRVLSHEDVKRKLYSQI